MQYSSLLIACIIHLLEKPPSCEHQLQKRHRLYCAKPIFRCDFDNKTFYAIQPPIKFHNMTKFILLSLQIYSVNICVMHFCDRSYKIIFLDGQLSSVITVTLQYLHRQLTVWYTRFTEKNKVWAKDVLFIMNFKCAPLRSLGGTGCIWKYILTIKTKTT